MYNMALKLLVQLSMHAMSAQHPELSDISMAIAVVCLLPAAVIHQLLEQFLSH